MLTVGLNWTTAVVVSSVALLALPPTRNLLLGISTPKPWTADDIPDLKGKVALVTGGNKGIGYSTVEELARHGAKVYLGARSASKAQAAIDQLRQKHQIPAHRLIWLPLDLSSLANVANAAKTLLASEERLDILVNNAASYSTNYDTTDDGFEYTMQVNHIGHWLLTMRLLPLLKKAASKPGAQVRVVNVSSPMESSAPREIEFTSRTDLNHPCSKPGSQSGTMPLLRRYGLSKLANILFTSELQRRLDAEGVAHITALSLNPGMITTDGSLGVVPYKIVGLLFSLIAFDTQHGALPSLFAATSPEINENQGALQGRHLHNAPRSFKNPSPRAMDPRLAKNLWDLTEAALKDLGY